MTRLIRFFLVISVAAAGVFLVQKNLQWPLSEHCSLESKKYAAETWNGYYNPEGAYAAGKIIQDKVRSKDLQGLLAFVDGELSNGPRKKFALSKTFDEVFPQQWVNLILNEEPSCDPVGWRGFMLGSGSLWYQVSGDKFEIVSINGATSEPLASVSAWLYKDNPIHPRCFTRNWISSDNFEEFEHYYKIATNDCTVSYKFTDGSSIDTCSSKAFRQTPGLFLGTKIKDFLPIRPRWCPDDSRKPCESIALVNSLRQCNDTADKLTTELGLTKLINNGLSVEYELIAPVSNTKCDNLAPGIRKKSSACYLVTIDEETGGSIGSVRAAGIYGVFDFPVIGKGMAPLIFFSSLNEALNYIERLKD